MNSHHAVPTRKDTMDSVRSDRALMRHGTGVSQVQVHTPLSGGAFLVLCYLEAGSEAKGLGNPRLYLDKLPACRRAGRSCTGPSVVR